MPSLFDPLRVGELELPNRILMAPLTRCRAVEERVPNSLMLEYYRQRASAGLIISEATSVSAKGVGYPNTPGIWSEKQVEGWKKITDAVHQAGGKMLLQLWHVGRISDPSYLNDEMPVSASAVAAVGNVSLMRPPKAFVTPRALELSEIPGIVAEYRRGAQNAKHAGFDGVEIHGANGYLLDQFLQSTTNLRTDKYGGPIANRARLMLEVTDACIEVWGAGRVGMHLAPRCDAHSMGDANPGQTFGFIARELGRRRIAFLCARESHVQPRLGPAMKNAFGGVFIANEKFTQATAQASLDAGEADAVAFGQLFIANPDLPRRFKAGAALNTPDPSTFYSGDAKGYTDYSFMDAEAVA